MPQLRSVMQLRFNPAYGYPRPQLKRERWTSLNGPWRFAFDNDRRYDQPADVASWPMSIEVPFPPESVASGVDDQGYHCACWYQRTFECTPQSERVLLHFGAVDYFTRVWVNGRLVATLILDAANGRLCAGI